jgi:hypothetical protein
MLPWKVPPEQNPSSFVATPAILFIDLQSGPQERAEHLVARQPEDGMADVVRVQIAASPTVYWIVQ